jgi:8-oxo-dGTP diphosphatase
VTAIWATVVFAINQGGKMRHKQPSLAVDAVVFDTQNRLLLIRRKFPPFKGRYALPGGFVELSETVEAAAARELDEETGLKAKTLRLIGVYSDSKRDPRGHTVSVAFLIQAGATPPKGGDDASAAAFVADWRNKKLAFDHNKIVSDALKLIGKS